MREKIGNILLFISYKAVWINDGERKGYFLLKRPITWIFIILPILIIPLILIFIYNQIMDVFNYDLQWIESDKKEKLTMKEKFKLVKRLFH